MDDAFLREQLVSMLKGDQTHMSFSDTVKDFPLGHINDIFPNGEYTFWHVLEHIRRTQKDILDFMVSTKYKEPKWPQDYWPARDAKAAQAAWRKTVEEFGHDLEKLIEMVQDPKTDLSAKVPNGTEQTFLREFLHIFDHNSYHLGEFAIMRQVLKLW